MTKRSKYITADIYYSTECMDKFHNECDDVDNCECNCHWKEEEL